MKYKHVKELLRLNNETKHIKKTSIELNRLQQRYYMERFFPQFCIVNKTLTLCKSSKKQYTCQIDFMRTKKHDLNLILYPLRLFNK